MAKYHCLALMMLGLCAPLRLPAQDTRVAQTIPAEIYGPPHAAHVVRIGNGGAGPTGLLRALAHDFLARAQPDTQVAWYQNISRVNLALLRRTELDMALTYEPALEEEAIAQGWATARRLVFHDHFILVGPPADPAGVQQTSSTEEAFARIYDAGTNASTKLFLSRHDGSGTHHKERAIWQSLSLQPWAPPAAWYVVAPLFPRQALRQADLGGLYTLTDHGTWLSTRGSLQNLAVLLRGGPQLLNPCHSVLGAQASPAARAFFDYLGKEGQKIIREYRAASGDAYFSPAAQADFEFTM